MKAVVIGGSGATGKTLVEQLLADDNYSEIIVLLRRNAFSNHPKLKQYVVDFEKLDDYNDLIIGDIAFSCLGTTLKDAGSKDRQWRVDYDYQLNFAKLAKQNNIERFVLLSAINASASSKIFYNKMKGQLEDAVKSLKFNNLFIVQPGGLIRPNTNRFGEIVGMKLLSFLNKLGLFESYKPLPVNVVAKSMIKAVELYKADFKIISLKDIIHLSIK